MKKRIMAAGLVILMLSGCGMPNNVLKEYAKVLPSNNDDITKIVNLEAGEPFASDLCVVPAADNAATILETEKVTEPDTFLETEEGESPVEGQETEQPDSTLEETQPEGDGITAASALVFGMDDPQIVYYKNIYEPVAPASITKILTALMVLKYGNFSDETVLTDAVNITVPGAKLCGFRTGDTLTVEQLFYSLLVYSGNDAANALAVYISGSVPEFCRKMNEEAKALGATNTNFVNPNGLDEEGHYTTAYDLYLIFKECLKYDAFKDAIQTKQYVCSYKRADGSDVESVFNTTNLYVSGSYNSPGGITVHGGKTGTTENAGSCLILYDTNSSGKSYISLLLGNSDKEELYAQMNKLLSQITN